MTHELAEQLLEKAMRSLPGAQIEVLVDRLSSALTRFANSYIHQNVEEDGVTINVRAHSEGRTVALYSNLTDSTALIERLEAMLAQAPLDSTWPGLAPKAPLTESSHVDDATRDAPPSARAALVRDFAQAAGGLEVAGYCRTSYWAGSFRNSAGQALDAAATDAVMDGIARRDGADGVARRSGARLSDLDGSWLGVRAAESARSQADPAELPAGRYEVILQPGAVADMLNNFALFGFNGRAFAQGRSFAELGKAQFDPSITIVDSPFDPMGGHPFDPEGTPRSRLVLVDKGITSAIAHDRRTAAESGTVSTGHAIGGGEPWGPMPQNIGFGPGETTTEQMLAKVERGILVADFWYTRVLDPRTLVVTGLTRNGAWLIEGGEVVRPVRNFRFTQGYHQALESGNVLGVGSEVVGLPNRYDMINTCAVALHLASWNFTGGASG